jgi:hypothetical protein
VIHCVIAKVNQAAPNFGSINKEVFNPDSENVNFLLRSLDVKVDGNCNYSLGRSCAINDPTVGNCSIVDAGNFIGRCEP